MLTGKQLLTFPRSVMPSSSAVYESKWHHTQEDLNLKLMNYYPI